MGIDSMNRQKVIEHNMSPFFFFFSLSQKSITTKSHSLQTVKIRSSIWLQVDNQKKKKKQESYEFSPALFCR